MNDDITRNDIDDIGKRRENKNSYKNRYFNGKRSARDEYTGKKVFYSSGKRFTTKTTSHVDHVVPLEKLKDRYGNTLSVSEIKDIANSDYNLAITSASLNESKKALDNHEYLIRQLRDGDPENALTTYNMLKMEVQSKISQEAQVTTAITVKKAGSAMNLTKQNIGKISETTGRTAGNAAGAGASAAIMSLTVSGINNIALVAAGEKDIKQAAIDISKDTGGSFLSGAGLDLLQDTIRGIAKNGGSKMTALPGNGLPIAEISTTIMIGNSIVRYINSEISAEQCFSEILMNGAGTVAYSLGMAFGGPAGAIAASMVTAQISKAALEYRAIYKMTEERLARVNSITAEALYQMEYQHCLLKDIVTEELKEWEEQFNKGFDEIFTAALSNNPDQITSGLDRILKVFGKNVRFKTSEEFDEFFMDENATFTF